MTMVEKRGTLIKPNVYLNDHVLFSKLQHGFAYQLNYAD